MHTPTTESHARCHMCGHPILPSPPYEVHACPDDCAPDCCPDSTPEEPPP